MTAKVVEFPSGRTSAGRRKPRRAEVFCIRHAYKPVETYIDPRAFRLWSCPTCGGVLSWERGVGWRDEATREEEFVLQLMEECEID